ncbi:hypothetical protein [Streptomyces flavidovirens]
MGFSIRQGHPAPRDLSPGRIGSFTIDLELTPGSAPLRGQREVIWVKFPQGTAFPRGGNVHFIKDGQHAERRPRFLTWDPVARLLRFEHELVLDADEQQPGFYAVDIQAMPDATPGELRGSIGIALEQAPLVVEIRRPRPVENLIRNGGFSDYTLPPGATWGVNRGVQTVGHWSGVQFLALADWTWGRYTGKGRWEYPTQAQDAIDLINGESDGHFPQDDEHPFARGENFVDINGNATQGMIEQRVDVEPGSAYELSFYTGYASWPGHDKGRPTYLRAEVDTGRAHGASTDVLAWDDYIQYYTGGGGPASRDPGQTINNPGWRKRRLTFRASRDTHQVTVRFSNPGRSGFHPDLGANPDGHSGMQLAHIWLAPAVAGTTLPVEQ